MELIAQKLEDWEVLSPSKTRLDAFVENSFRKALADGTDQIMLDLSRVEFMDSSGLGVLVACRRMRGESERIVLAGAEPGIASTLQLTQLDKVFPVVESPQPVLETVW